MTEEGGSGMRLVCPTCGTARRDRGARYCSGCGLDYWRLAAGGSMEPPKGARRKWRFPGRVQPGQPPPTGELHARGVEQTPAAPVANPQPPRLSRLPGGLMTRLPRSPRSRLVAAGAALAIALLVAATLVMRPAAPAAALPTASPSPSPPSPDAVITAFFTTVRDPGAAFALKFAGTVTQAVGPKRSTATISGDLEISGENWAGTLRLAQPGAQAFSGSIVHIGQTSWMRAQGATAWRQQALQAQAESVDPFVWISTVDEISYLRVGPGQNGRRTHLLETTKWLSGTEYDEILLKLTDPQHDSRMDVETTDAGVPLRATYRFTIRGKLTDGTGSLELGGSTAFTFAHWGEAITISPPR